MSHQRCTPIASAYRCVKTFGQEHAGIANVLSLLPLFGGVWAAATNHAGLAFSACCFAVALGTLLALGRTVPSNLAGVDCRQRWVRSTSCRHILWAVATIFLLIGPVPFIPYGTILEEIARKPAVAVMPKPTDVTPRGVAHPEEKVVNKSLSHADSKKTVSGKTDTVDTDTLKTISMQYEPYAFNNNTLQSGPRYYVGNTGTNALWALITSSAKLDAKLANALKEREQIRKQLRVRDRDGGPTSSLQALAEELRQKNSIVLDLEFAAIRQFLPEDTLVRMPLVVSGSTTYFYSVDPKNEEEATQRNIGTLRLHIQKSEPLYRAKLTELDNLHNDLKQLEEDLHLMTIKANRDKTATEITKTREKIKQVRKEANEHQSKLLRQAIVELNAERDYQKTDLLVGTYCRFQLATFV